MYLKNNFNDIYLGRTWNEYKYYDEMHELTRLNVSKRILTKKEKLKKLWYKMKTIVPPILSPHFKQDIDLIENVQRSFTRKLFYCCNLVSKSCVDRLT